MICAGGRRRKHRGFALGVGLALLLPGALGASVRWVDRPDEMEVYRLADVDRLGDRVRILYQTLPSLEQAADRENWRVNVYLAEIRPDGSVDQRSLASGRRHFNSLVLRRGHDEVFAVPAPGGPGLHGQTLERWSGKDGSVLWSGEVDAVPDLGTFNRNIHPTDDGNLFVVNSTQSDSRNAATTEITWQVLSPSGETLATGSYGQGGPTLDVVSAFPATGGGVGLLLRIGQGRDGAAIRTELAPIRHTVHGREIEATVFSETRLLTAGRDGRLRWLSPALARTFLWGGEMAIPSDLPPEEILAQQSEQMAWMSEVEATNAGGADPGPVIKRTPEGQALLSRVSADRDREPPIAGPHLIEVGSDGSLRRDLYLQDVADRLETQKFVDFLPLEDRGFLLVGQGAPPGTKAVRHATRVDAQGSPRWSFPLEGTGHLDGVAGTAEHAWAYGNDWRDGSRGGRLWVERIDEAGGVPLAEISREAEPPEPSSEAPPPQARGADVPKEAAPGECSCSCEEYAKLREFLARVEKMTDEEKMKLATDTDFLARMTCASTCAMQYAACPRK